MQLNTKNSHGAPSSGALFQCVSPYSWLLGVYHTVETRMFMKFQGKRRQKITTDREALTCFGNTSLKKKHE